MVLDGGITELMPGDLLRYVTVKDPTTGKPQTINLKKMTHEEIKKREKESPLFVPGAVVSVSMSDPDFDDKASAQLRRQR